MTRHTVFAAMALCLLCCTAPSVATAATAGAQSSPAPGAALGAPTVATGLGSSLGGAPAQAPAPAASSPAATAPSPTSWTFAVYANGDNNLEYTWPQFTLRALRALPANADVNVVAMIDWHSVKKGVQLLQFSGGKVTVVASWPDKDFGAEATFTWFLKQIATRYPSTHLAVDIWDHGYGWRYISDDFTSNDRITMPELRNAIRAAAVPIDVLCFDACNMANVEAVSEIGSSKLVRYVVGSEETIDPDGYPYGGALRPLLADPSRTPRQVAGDMVSAWQGYYRPLRCFDWVSLSALDVDQVMQARTDITAWVARLHADLPQDRPLYAADLHHSIYAWDCWYVDMADVAGRLAADPAITDATLKMLSTTVADDLTGAVVALWSGSYASAFKGITIWWGTGSDWRADQGIYRRQIAFADQTGWYEFLKAYNAGHLPGPSQAPNPAVRRANYGLTDVAFADADHGWATGYNNVSSEAVILRTTDGGRHWTTKSPAWWDTYMTSSLAFVTARRAWAVGSEGDYESAIVKTIDGGLNWSWQDSDTAQYLLGADFLNATHGWVCGSRGTLLQTTDGGRMWSGKRGASVTDLWSVDFTDAAHGWVAGGNAGKTDGVIRHTSDGGLTWTTQVTTPGAVIYKVAALDGSQAWAVGGSPVSGAGIIIHTSDGGLTWQPQYGGPSIPWLCDATFVDASTGWAVGEHGTVLRTTDGGLTWTTVTVPTHEDLTAVWFTGAANGWIVGDGAAMLHSTDGGATWTTTRADVIGPRTFAPTPSTVSRSAGALLRYRVTDAQSATATVTIKITDGDGRTVATLSLGRCATAAQHVARFVCRLPRGAYRFSVYARDEAGNAQTRVGSNVLTVK
jgi:photosystem II stability/assembly factor-like uncharacterized protein